jgi:hypothetical protein
MDPAPLAYELITPEQRRDAQHLKLLSIFHYIAGGLIAAIACIFIFHIVLGAMMLISPRTVGAPSDPREAAFLGAMMLAIGTGGVLAGWALGAATIYSGRCIARRRFWMFSLIIAGLMCMQFPIGTALGVFTFVTLLRASVKETYRQHGASAI